MKKTTTKKPTAKAKPAAVAPTGARPFVPGQKWQLPTGHAEVIQVGKTLVHYRFLKTGQVRGGLEMKSIPNFAEALKANKARLIAS